MDHVVLLAHLVESHGWDLTSVAMCSDAAEHHDGYHEPLPPRRETLVLDVERGATIVLGRPKVTHRAGASDHSHVVPPPPMPACPHCGGPWPWMWYRDSSGEVVGCDHEVEFRIPSYADAFATRRVGDTMQPFEAMELVHDANFRRTLPT